MNFFFICHSLYSYWERRRRNNESAKRSRESRRRKEMQTTIGIMVLEQENVKLRAEVNLLREELNRLRQNELLQYLMMNNNNNKTTTTAAAAQSPDLIKINHQNRL